MTQKVTCVSIDLINADKPPASLAFMAGACEAAAVDYQCISINSVLIKKLSQQDYNKIYADIKTEKLQDSQQLINPVVQEIVEQIVSFKTGTVLISLFSYMQYSLGETFLQALRLSNPAIEIIAGGPGVSAESHKQTNGKRLLDSGLVDFYCLGEGDEILVNFLKGQKQQLGLNSRADVYETWTPQIDNLDQYSVLPSYKKIELSSYRNLENKTSAVFSLSTSRGCVRSCSFCDVGKTWKKFRFRSGAHVASEILQHHQDVGAVHFTIVDSLINGSLRSFREFNAEMVKVKQQHPTLSDFSYNGMFIVRDKKSHPSELFALMKQAGCESLAIGVETGSDRVRFDMNKKFTNADLDYHLEMCQLYGIRNTFLMFVGYPTETREDFELTLELLDRYQKYLIDDTIIGINHSGIFTLLPDTPVYDHRQDLGIEIVDDNVNKNILNWVSLNNPDLDVKERILRDLEFRKKALDLRYPIPYATRYLDYLSKIHPDFVPQSD
jgi:radical SAM superfamily enzyme YgiQ (UPF0313 family)